MYISLGHHVNVFTHLCGIKPSSDAFLIISFMSFQRHQAANQSSSDGLINATYMVTFLSRINAGWINVTNVIQVLLRYCDIYMFQDIINKKSRSNLLFFITCYRKLINVMTFIKMHTCMVLY